MNKNLFPFKVYKLADYRPGQVSDAIAWRTVRVRAGAFVHTGPGPICATGTDWVNNPDDQSDIPDYDTAIDITLPDSAASYWVWLSVTLRANQTPIVTVLNSATSEEPTEWSRTLRPLAQVHVEPNSKLWIDQIVRGYVFDFRI